MAVCAVHIFIVQPPGLPLNCCVRNESGERLPTSGQKEVESMKQSLGKILAAVAIYLVA